MSEQTRTIIKRYFETGDRPKAEEFAEFLDLYINKIDDGISIDQESKSVGIGKVNPEAKLDIDGSILLGKDNTTPKAGTIRWSGSDFEGYNGKEWLSLTFDKNAINEIYIPPINIECTADTVRVYWDECRDKRFLDYKPEIWLYRYKSRIKKPYNGKSKNKKIVPKKWSIPDADQTNNTNYIKRETKFTLSKKAGQKIILNIRPEHWLKQNPRDKESNYIPRGQGMYPIPKNDKKYFNRRFEYFKLRIVLSKNGKSYGPFSEVFSLGSRRRYHSNKETKKYKAVFELVQPGAGMNRNSEKI